MFLFKQRSKTTKVTQTGKTIRISPMDDNLSYQVSNLQELGARSNQEDSFALINALDVNEIIEKGLFAIVADGMGGMKDGKLVSEEAVSGFVHVFRNMNRELNIPKQLVENARSINDTIRRKFEGEGGTTVVLVMIYQGNAYWVSVGDSTIFLKRNGILVRLNKEHTYRNQLYLKELDKATINKTEIEANEDGVRLSEFLGNTRVDEIDYNEKPLKLRKGDTILLCSDGISGFLDEKSISDALDHPPELSCELLKKLIYEKSKKDQDNLTAIIISCVN